VYLERNAGKDWIKNPLTGTQVDPSIEPVPRPDVELDITAAYQQALSQWEQREGPNTAATTTAAAALPVSVLPVAAPPAALTAPATVPTPVPAAAPPAVPTPVPAAAPPVALIAPAAVPTPAAVLGAPRSSGCRGRGGGDGVDTRLPIGFNFSDTSGGSNALKQILLQASTDGFENSLAHGKRKKWIADNIDRWFDRQGRGILSE
jgi:hypothetical protein